MHRRWLVPVFALALLAPACGGSDDDGATGGTDTTVADEGADTTAADDGGGTGDLDCATITEAAGSLGLVLQILAQLRTVEQYALVHDGTIGLDADAALANVEALRAVEDYEIPEGYGSVEEALDTYEEAITLAKENLAVDDPFTQAKGDELAALTEDVQAFLSGQVTIGLALDQTDC